MEHNKDRMVFTVTAYNKTVTIDVSDDLMIYDFLDHCRDLALAMGYDMSIWKEAVIDAADYYKEEEEKQVEKNLRDYGDYTTKANHKVYTGKSDLGTYWNPATSTPQDTPSKEYTDWIKKNIHDSNC